QRLRQRRQQQHEQRFAADDFRRQFQHDLRRRHSGQRQRRHAQSFSHRRRRDVHLEHGQYVQRGYGIDWWHARAGQFDGVAKQSAEPRRRRRRRSQLQHADQRHARRTERRTQSGIDEQFRRGGRAHSRQRQHEHLHLLRRADRRRQFDESQRRHFGFE